jgi:hypothetical protein
MNFTIQTNDLTPFLLKMFLNKYGNNFFSKLGKYKTVSLSVRVNGEKRKQYFAIERVREDLQIDLFSPELGKITVNWFDCWDFVL